MARNLLTIRGLLQEDKARIGRILEKIPQFTDEERQCALELVDLYINQGERSGYDFFISQDEEKVLLGYICFGRVPLTEGCFDIYWIVVDPGHQDQGIGTRLLKAVEEKTGVKGARKLLTETSSQKKYLSAQNFYQKMGFRLICFINDFYKIGDGKMVFVKDLERK